MICPSRRFLQKTNKRILLYYYETSGRLVFVRFLEEIEYTKNTFRNYLTFNRNISQQDLYTMIFNSDLEPHTVRRPTNWFFLQNSCYAVCPLMNSIMSFVASNQRIVTAKMTTVAPPPHYAAVRRAARRGQMAPSSGFKQLKIRQIQIHLR